jgi:3-deoxy-D-manno-octulosonate 8-phosphate phosphatase (KDO 8-P phosphatase)
MKKQINEKLLEKAAKVKLLLMDCDGVLTDGRLYYSDKGETLKVFNVKDGQGIVMWHRAGFKSGIISGRNSKIVSVRAAELGMHYVKVGSQDKVKDFEEIFESAGIKPEEVAYIGDDLPDITLLKKVGLSIAVSDSVREVIDEADYVTKQNGGLGAVREVTDLLLKVKTLKQQ